METKNLSTSLQNVWSNYEELLKLSSKKSNNRNIHKLRIATQRLEAGLILSSGITDSRWFDKLIQELRHTRKQIGPLRDLYVERKIARKWPPQLQFFYSKKFSTFLKDKIKSEEKADKKFLKTIPLKKQKKHIGKIIWRLKDQESRLEASEIQKLKDNTLEKSFIQVKETLREMKPDDIKTLHHFRVQSKRLRYQKEFVEPSAVDPLIEIQQKVGTIIDQKVMTKTLKKFLKDNA